MCPHAIDLVYLGPEPVDNQAFSLMSMSTKLVLNLAAINVSPDDHRREVSLVLLGGDLAPLEQTHF